MASGPVMVYFLYKLLCVLRFYGKYHSTTGNGRAGQILELCSVWKALSFEIYS
jgi:hypothetical protein